MWPSPPDGTELLATCPARTSTSTTSPATGNAAVRVSSRPVHVHRGGEAEPMAASADQSQHRHHSGEPPARQPDPPRPLPPEGRRRGGKGGHGGRESPGGKDKGNAFYRSAKLTEAIEMYSLAIAMDPSWHIPYSNRATAYFGRKWWVSLDACACVCSCACLCVSVSKIFVSSMQLCFVKNTTAVCHVHIS